MESDRPDAARAHQTQAPGPPRQETQRDSRQCLNGILFVLIGGIPWELLPRQMGLSGMTCWRRLRDWQAAGVWKHVWGVCLDVLNSEGKLRFSREVVDAMTGRPERGNKTGPSPVDRRKPGPKYHVPTGARGIPLPAELTPANTNEVTQAGKLADSVPGVAGKPGHPAKRLKEIQGDRAFDSEPKRRGMRQRGIKPLFAKRGAPHGSRLGQDPLGRGKDQCLAGTVSWPAHPLCAASRYPGGVPVPGMPADLLELHRTPNLLGALGMNVP